MNHGDDLEESEECCKAIPEIMILNNAKVAFPLMLLNHDYAEE